MPASQFFSMRRSALMLKAEENISLCDISAIPMCTHEWYNDIRTGFVNISKELRGEKEITLPPEEVNNEAARQFLFGVIAAQRGG